MGVNIVKFKLVTAKPLFEELKRENVSGTVNTSSYFLESTMVASR